MKKWMLILISLVLFVCLSACSKDENSNKSSEQKKESATKTAEPFQHTESAATGNVIAFGRYEQDNNPDNGPEPIEWIVLEEKDGKALLLCKYGLDAKPYNTEYTDVTWENCSLRTWLNNDFLITAFSETEQRAILLTEVDNSDAQGISWWNVTGGNNTQDYLFLLSFAEAGKCLGVQVNGEEGANQNPKSRVAPTAYAIANGAWTSPDYMTEDGKLAGRWWLRSPGGVQSDAAYVSTFGTVYNHEVNKYGDEVVRPTLWLNLESDF